MPNQLVYIDAAKRVTSFYDEIFMITFFVQLAQVFFGRRFSCFFTAIN
jgi:hypothetical protein